ncbi:GNAT family N-acetyltransferase [Ideonella sp. DXS22W]|uniref:GNAT family N-acetyltransferase n=1 Tax=Pseudaquabacterium inlustre TaxID=2984192 RepID=A0ABU9CMK5_9BURK
MHIALEPADQPDVIALINALDDYQKPLYPAESHHGIDIAALSRPEVIFAVARDATGGAVACGAIVLCAEYGELKRMFTLPSQRGQGVAARILALLQHSAVARGCRHLMLETGPLQPEALAFYARQGFVRRGPFGDYWDDPHSVFMEKTLIDAVSG